MDAIRKDVNASWQVRICVILSILIAGVLVGRHVALQRLDAPSIDVEARIVDLGVIPFDMKVSRTIKIYNRGDGDLEITDLRTGCGCTELAIGSRQLAPHTATELRITQAGTAYREQFARETDVFLFTNDPNSPECHLLVRYQSSPQPFLDPSRVDFGQIQVANLPKSTNCRLVYPHATPDAWSFAELTLFVGAPFLHATKRQTARDSIMEIEVTLDSHAPLGGLYYPLRLTGAGGNTMAETYVMGNVRGWCFSLPQAIDLGKVTREGPLAAERVAFESRKSADSLATVEIQTSEELKDVVDIKVLEPEGSSVAVSVHVDLTNKEMVWSKPQYCGYFMALCSNLAGLENWVAVPIRFRTDVPNIRLKHK